MSPFFYIISLYLVHCIPSGYSLRCHICDSFGSSSNCTDAPLEKCSRSEDACVISTTWTGKIFNEMKVTKSCGSSDVCHNIDSNQPICYQTENGWECQLCCQKDGCNSGGNGEAPRPPPYPPVPQPLVERLTATCVPPSDCRSVGQRLLWDDKSSTVLVNEICTSPGSSIQNYHQNYLKREQCNIPSEPGFCVKCCTDDCKNNGSQLQTSHHLLPIVLMTCAFVRWLLASS
ncbi:uncharacterized protein [Amphiura filiformis]|uniref:uncharacterized protein isoform X2 n=1 Tax=Amphiura filiformis TaxID=82378 RepID=UPI003B210B7D